MNRPCWGRRNGVRTGSFMLFVWCVWPRSVHAQQAIVSLPSADVTPERKLFGMVESQFRAGGPKASYNSTTFFCFGLDGNTELAVSLYNAGAPSTGNMARTDSSRFSPSSHVGATRGSPSSGSA